MSTQRPAQARENYDKLANEYYLPVAHPTCAALRAASALSFASFLGHVQLRGQWCELGTGKSLLLDVASSLCIAFERPPILCDVSSRMLQCTPTWQRRTATLVLADALTLPFQPSTFAGIAMSLADPYNGEVLWSEIGRVAASACQVCFTVPDYEWARRYRAREGSPMDVARFALASGQVIDTPSIVLPERDQIAVAAAAGFRLHRLERISRKEVGSLLAPKLDGVANVLTSYWFRRL